MEDREIIRLYQKRDEQAIAASRSKYGAFLYGIAMNILHQNQDAEECESDTYHNAWRHIPPDNPWALRAYLGKITRRLSISRYRKNHAEKRNSELEVLLEELDQCIPDSLHPGAGIGGKGAGGDHQRLAASAARAAEKAICAAVLVRRQSGAAVPGI